MDDQKKKYIIKKAAYAGLRINRDREHLRDIGYAAPAFYMIMDKAEEECPQDEADHFDIYGDSHVLYKVRPDMTQADLEAAKGILFDGKHGLDRKDAEYIRSGVDLEVFLMTKDCSSSDLYRAVMPVKNVWLLRKNYVFLSWKEAERFIKKAQGLVSKDAYPYAMTADSLCKDYRAMYSFIAAIDFEKSKFVMK